MIALQHLRPIRKFLAGVAVAIVASNPLMVDAVRAQAPIPKAAQPPVRQPDLRRFMRFCLEVFRVEHWNHQKWARRATGADSGSWRLHMAGGHFGYAIDEDPASIKRGWAAFYDGAVPGDAHRPRYLALWLLYAGTGSMVASIAEDGPRPGMSKMTRNNPVADAIVCIERQQSTICWDQNGDVRIPASEIDAEFLAECAASDGAFLVGFADGEVWRLRVTVPPVALQPFFTVDGARHHDRDTELTPYRLD